MKNNIRKYCIKNKNILLEDIIIIEDIKNNINSLFLSY